MAIESVLPRRVLESIATFGELAGWAATRACELATAILELKADPAARVIVAEFASEHCRKRSQAAEFVAAADSVLDSVALAELLLSETTVHHVRALMVLATRPAVRLWIAYVVVRDHRDSLGEHHSLIAYCTEMMLHIRTVMA